MTVDRETDLAFALFGAPSAFAEPLHVGRPNVGSREAFLSRVQDIYDRRWFSNGGPYVEQLEAKVASIAGTKHCIACCNGTVALEIAIRALNMRNEVILPAFTFIATAHALQWQGITPVFADVQRGDHNLSPAQIEHHLSPRTSGILGVHLWGRPCDTEAIEAIARRRGLAVLYDGSHAFGCATGSRPIGGQGRATVFSFHATKFVNTLEGGAIVTDDDALAARARLMKNFGFRTYDEVVHVGTNGKMNEVSAAMGLTNLEAMAEIVAINEENHRAYREGLAGIAGLHVMPYDGPGTFNFQYVTCEVDPSCAISRDTLLRLLWAENVRVRRYFYPGCHLMEPYRTLYPEAGRHLPETERLASRILVLPTGQSIGRQEVATICALVRRAVASGPAIEQRLRAR